MASIQTPAGNPKFVDQEIVNRHLCKVCLNVARNSMQTSCGHRVCEPCVHSIFQDKPHPVECPARDHDCDRLFPHDITPDPSGRKEVRNLKVYCNNQSHGCKEQCRWADLEKHLPVCTFNPVHCANSQHGCPVMLPFASVQSHFNECEYHLQNCRHCGRQVPKKLEKVQKSPEGLSVNNVKRLLIIDEVDMNERVPLQ